MAQITTGVEYALHCLLYLTKSHATVDELSVRDLAALQGISHEYLAKLFSKLSKAGLVTATEGVNGGFRLARSAHRISVHDVIIAIDGNKPLFVCREVRRRCAVFDQTLAVWPAQGVCSVHAVMQRAEKAMRAELKRHTLDNLAQRVVDKTHATYRVEIIRWLSHRPQSRQAAAPDAARTVRRKTARIS